MPTTFKPARYYSDPQFAQRLSSDPVLTGVPAITFGAEDEQLILEAIKKMLGSDPSLEARIGQKANLFRSMQNMYKKMGMQRSSVWTDAAQDYINLIMGKLHGSGQELQPGINRYIDKWASGPEYVSSAYLGERLNPLGVLEYSKRPATEAIKLSGEEVLPAHPSLAKIFRFAADMRDPSFASRLAPIHLLTDFARDVHQSGIETVSPGIFSEYTGNLLQQIMDTFRKRGKL